MIKSQQSIRISNNIKRFRLASGWNQRKLANVSGLTCAGISKIESCKVTSPTITSLRKISEALNVSVGEITGERVVENSILNEKYRVFFRKWAILDDLSQNDQAMLMNFADRML